MLGLGLTSYIPLLVYLLGIFIIVIGIFYRVEIGLLFLIPLLPLQNILQKIHQFPAGKDFVDIILLSLALGWFLRALIKKERLFERSPINLLICLLAVFTFIQLLRGSSFLGVDLLSFRDERFMDWKNYMLLPLLYILTVNNIKDRTTLKLLLFLIIVSMIAMDYAFYSNFKWVKKWHFTYKMRTQGTFVFLGPNELAAFYVQYTMVLLGIFLFDEHKWRRILLGGAIIGNFYCIVYSFSRAAYLSTIVGVSFLFLVKNRKVLIIFLVFLCLSPTFLPVSVIDRINMTVTESDSISYSLDAGDAEGTFDNSSESRLEFWKFAFDNFKRHPLLGTGYNTYVYLQSERRDTHNIYLKILSEMGIIGLIIFLALLFISLKSGWQLYKAADERFMKGLGLGFSACVITCLINNIFGDRWTYVQLSAYYWVFLGLVVRGKTIEEECLTKKTLSKAAL